VNKTLPYLEWAALSLDLQRNTALAVIEQNPDMGWRAGFAAYLEENMVVVVRCIREAKAVRVRHHHYSMRTIVEFIRHQTKTYEAASQFKINNNMAPDIARLAMLLVTELEGMFELRSNELRDLAGAA
jgi:hypothetical protein